ncbi:MAG: hypothetical protein HYW62_02515 [Candidatus Levybacteria bacterium]|nr:hypothetical protein [Candidatus Levybacteria bacterium]
MKELKILYLFIFILGAILIIPTHIFPQPYFMPFRFPHYLEMMGSFSGVSWPVTFEIYHLTLLVIGIIGVINILGLIFPNMRTLAKLSSLIGLFLFSLMVLFFFFVFINVNISTAIIYGFYSIVLLIADILTFKALIKRRKAA